MKICPVAIAVGCRKCPVFNVCPAKGIIGDYTPEEKAKDDKAGAAKAANAKKGK
ncbi:hypothetical protein [Usitatibacter palustris]|uniref:Uncharacterized protein n=1 Tax=Usitatibacter palustris TaxID=2732487 RepID=A0A6M4H8Z4_9PROT|nr:hypothetical protein [Usitatibacter palustris]QJR16051.1 hypothetical protein DSM104440_02879 [Usitatibacter palustris]